MELAEVEDRLYAVDPDEFMSARTEQVASAKAAGDKALAKAIGGLRKPTRSAWLVNRLARASAAELEELLELGAALREAQQNLAARELRALSSQRTKVVNGLSRRAVTIGAEAGYTANEAARQEVAQTLQAALADPEAGERVRRGVLAQSLSYGGFGTFGTAPAPAAAPSRSRAEPQTDTPEPEPDAERDAEREAAREAARAAWQEAKEALAEAEVEADRATVDADGLADRLEELRRQLAETEAAEEEARRNARQARQRVVELTAAEQAARELVED